MGVCRVSVRWGKLPRRVVVVMVVSITDALASKWIVFLLKCRSATYQSLTGSFTILNHLQMLSGDGGLLLQYITGNQRKHTNTPGVLVRTTENGYKYIDK